MTSEFLHWNPSSEIQTLPRSSCDCYLPIPAVWMLQAHLVLFYSGISKLVFYYRKLYNQSSHCFSSVLTAFLKLEAEVKCNVSWTGCAWMLPWRTHMPLLQVFSIKFHLSCYITWVCDILKQKSVKKIQPPSLWISEIRHLRIYRDVWTPCLHQGSGICSHCWWRTFLDPEGTLQQNAGSCSWQQQWWSRENNGMKSSLGLNKMSLDSLRNGLRLNSGWGAVTRNPEHAWNQHSHPADSRSERALSHNTWKLVLWFSIAIFFPTA